MQIGTTGMLHQWLNISVKSIEKSPKGTLHLNTTTCHNCLHFCVILFVPFANFKLGITLKCQGRLFPCGQMKFSKNQAQ